MIGLCDTCHEAEQKWINIDPKDARAIATATGKPAIETIRAQLKLIREGCQANHAA